MPRETTAQQHARARADNAAAVRIPAGTTVQDALFGALTLGPNLGPAAVADGWEMYEVRHSGLTHAWSSAAVAGAFGLADAERY